MPTTPDWLKSAVFYQVYPQSFYDSNGDGIGDIRGLIEKLDYIQSLGCNAIWINPCFVSPFDDAGYDVADYYKIASRYGTNTDMRRLFSAARKKDIRICLDLVPGHTSIQHQWFKQSSRHTKNRYSNRYIWTDSIWSIPSPDIARTVNGYSSRDGNYVANFFWCQPALNYGFAKVDPNARWQLPVDHPDVLKTREEMKNIIRFWLDMGASGFRVDMASSLVKNDPGKKETSHLWQDICGMVRCNYPDAVMISEWFDPPKAVKAGFHVDFAAAMDPPYQIGTPYYRSLFRNEKGADRIDLPVDNHSFFNRQGRGDVSFFLHKYLRQYKQIDKKGYVGFYTGNHDLPRISLNRTRAEIELVFVFVLTMPGVPFIYYGDEIGLKHLGGLSSKEGGYNRTGARTPMQWNTRKNAGFSTAKAGRLYLPIDPRCNRPNVETQEGNRKSLLNIVRQLIKLRKQIRPLHCNATFLPLYAQPYKYPLVYLRQAGRHRVLVAINPSGSSTEIKLSTLKCGGGGFKNRLMGSHSELIEKKNNLILRMQRVSYGVFESHESAS